MNILFEDDDILLINKPLGLVVHHGAGVESNTLYDYLIERYPNVSDEFKNDFRMGIVHRLDKDTTGLMVIAKNIESATNLIEQFKAHSIKKEYTALCYAFFNTLSGTIDAPLGRSKSNRKKFSVQKDGSGKNAISHYEVEDQFLYGKNNKNAIALLKVTIETGRTHQIRVHMSSIGHPVVNDTVYGKNRWKEGEELGLMLEATSLAFDHPRTSKRLEFSLPLSERFSKAIKLIKAM